MSIVEPIFIKLISGDTISIKQLDLDNPKYSHSIHTIHTLGDYSEVTELNINNVSGIKFGGGTIFNALPITKLDIVSSASGVLVIGKKQKREIF